MKLSEMIPDYDAGMTKKYKKKLDTFRKIANLQKKLYEEYPNQYRVANYRIPDDFAQEKNIAKQLDNWQAWERTALRDVDDLTTYMGGVHTKSIYRYLQTGLCVLVDEVQAVDDYKPTYKFYIIYIQKIEN